MTRVEATFERASGTTGIDAFNSVTGSPTLVTSGLIRGPNSFRCNWTGSANTFGSLTGYTFTAAYYSAYLYIGAAPSTTARMIAASNGASQWDVRMTATPTLQFRWGSTILYTTPTLGLSTIYRIGIYYQCESVLSAADGVMTVWYATGDDDFGAAKATSSVVTMTVSNGGITQTNWGMSNTGAITGDVYFDDIRIDDGAMPGPSLYFLKPVTPIPTLIRT